MKIALEIFAIVFGVVLILAAAFNWPIVVWGSPSDPMHPPPSGPTIGTGGRRMPPGVRVAVALVGALLVVLGVVFLVSK